MIGYYNYTVILTYTSLVSSLVGIFFAAGVGGGEPQPDYAVICLMISGLCDMFDGKIARTRSRTESEKNFGIQIDFLCDLVCFGVLPAAIGYSIGMKSWFDVPVLVLFPPVRRNTSCVFQCCRGGAPEGYGRGVEGL